MRIKTPRASAAAPPSPPTGSQRRNSQTYRPATQKFFVTRHVDKPCQACVRSVSVPRCASDDQPRISRFGSADAEKFHDLQKISSMPELKYFGLASLLCLHRNITGRRGHPYRAMKG